MSFTDQHGVAYYTSADLERAKVEAANKAGELTWQAAIAVIRYHGKVDDLPLQQEAKKSLIDALDEALTKARVEVALEQREADEGVLSALLVKNVPPSDPNIHEKACHNSSVLEAFDAIHNNPLAPGTQHLLDGLLAKARLEEAKWWEHLVGNIKPDHSENHEPDCLYCQRIAQLEAEAKERK